MTLLTERIRINYTCSRMFQTGKKEAIFFRYRDIADTACQRRACEGFFFSVDRRNVRNPSFAELPPVGRRFMFVWFLLSEVSIFP